MLFGQDIRDGVNEAIDGTFYEVIGRKLFKNEYWKQTRLGNISEYAIQSETIERIVSKLFNKYDVDVVLFFEFCKDSIHYPLTYEMMRDNKDLPPVPKYVFVNTSSGIKRARDISELNNYLSNDIRYEDTGFAS